MHHASAAAIHAPRRVRRPFEREFTTCTCGAVEKDDCSCTACGEQAPAPRNRCRLRAAFTTEVFSCNCDQAAADACKARGGCGLMLVPAESFQRLACGMRSSISAATCTATSGVAASPNTDFVASQAKSSVSATSVAEMRTSSRSFLMPMAVSNGFSYCMRVLRAVAAGLYHALRGAQAAVRKPTAAPAAGEG